MRNPFSSSHLSLFHYFQFRQNDQTKERSWMSGKKWRREESKNFWLRTELAQKTIECESEKRKREKVISCHSTSHFVSFHFIRKERSFSFPSFLSFLFLPDHATIHQLNYWYDLFPLFWFPYSSFPFFFFSQAKNSVSVVGSLFTLLSEPVCLNDQINSASYLQEVKVTERKGRKKLWFLSTWGFFLPTFFPSK